MPGMQGRVVNGSLLLAESLWLYAVLGVVGVFIGLNGSPTPWIAVFALLVLSFLIAQSLQRALLPLEASQAVLMFAGALSIYLTLGVVFAFDASVIDLLWVTKVKVDGEPLVEAVVLGAMAGIGLWWRGAKLASETSVSEVLAFTFKAGVLALVLASIVDIASSADLHVLWVMLPFFGASLMGLAASQVAAPAPGATDPKSWIRVIVGIVASVVALGALLSLVRSEMLSPARAVVGFIYDILITVVIWVIVIPSSYFVELFLRFLGLLVNLFSRGDDEQEPFQGPVELAQQFRDTTGEPGGTASILLTSIQWLFIALLILLALYILGMGLRRRFWIPQGESEVPRESIRGEAVPAQDLTDLLIGLIPARWRGSGRRSYRVPLGERGITEVFQIYFRLLSLAGLQGSLRPAWETPIEYEGALQSLFLDVSLQPITSAFNRACYGRIPSSDGEIRHMRGIVDGLAAQMKGKGGPKSKSDNDP